MRTEREQSRPMVHSRYSMEFLEPRVLLSNNWAPASLVGRAATTTISSGTGIYATSGSQLFAVSSANNTYDLLTLTGSAEDSFGTYTWTQTSGTTGTIQASDTTLDVSETDSLVFTSAGGGTFSVSSAGGTQSGSFTVAAAPTGTAPTSVAGDLVTFTISQARAGNSHLVTSGSYVVTVSANESSYQLTGVVSSSGTLSYDKTTTGTGVLNLQDATVGALTGGLSFSSATSGTYVVGNASTDSWQIGTFTIDATKLVFTQQPTNAFAGIEIAPPISIALEDASGDVVTTDTSTVTLTGHGGPAIGSGSRTAVNGVATFSTVVVDAPGTYTMTASDGSLTGATSISFTISVPGWIDTANMNVISGWGFDPTDPANPANIEIVITGGPTQTFSADQSRPDLTAIVGDANHGFTYSAPVLSAGNHTAYVYVVEGNSTKLLIATETLVSQNSLFDEHYYLKEYPNVAAAVANGEFATGYDHYIKYGQYEGYSPSPYWSESWYLLQNPDVAAAVRAGTISSGFMHYYLYGQYENRSGLLYFNSSYYLTKYPDVAAAVTAGSIPSAFEHFVLYGQYEGRSPMKYFSSSVYDSHNAGILSEVTGETFSSDFEQFVEQGQYEGLIASNYYDEVTYLADNADVAAAVMAHQYPDGFRQWLEYGQYEGRTAV